MEAWVAATDEDLDSAFDLVAALDWATGCQQGAFFEQWTRRVYDVQAVMNGLDLGKKPPEQPLKTFIRERSRSFFKDLLQKDAVPNPVEAQRQTELRSVAPTAIAEACARVSVGNGLPPDGHLVHAALQGQAAFYWAGPRAQLKVLAMAGTDSDWNVASSRLPLIVEGDSAAGKDNLKNVALSWIAALEAEDSPATTVLKQGNLTVTGILDALEHSGGQIQILNGELEKIVCKKRDRYLQDGCSFEMRG